MKDMDFFNLLHTYLAERQTNNIYENLKQDKDYLNATNLEEELSNQYERLDLSNEQRKVIEKWVDAIHAQDEAYTVVVFRMAVQYCFAMLLELADLK